MCIGGPALIYWVMPSEEELFMVRPTCSNTIRTMADIRQRYNPELQRRSLERRKEKQEDFDNFVNRLKQHSKSDKPSMLQTCSNRRNCEMLIACSLDRNGERRCSTQEANGSR